MFWWHYYLHMWTIIIGLKLSHQIVFFIFVSHTQPRDACPLISLKFLHKHSLALSDVHLHINHWFEVMANV